MSVFASIPYTNFLFDYVVSGCVWTADAPGSTRAASMTAGTIGVSGAFASVAAVTSRTFTASKDTYIDVDNTGTITYTEVANNAAAPALAANNVRLGIIITGASNIANSGSVNQGQENMLLPIASSIPYAVTDSLGNLICPRDPNRRILGYREVTSDQSTSSASFVDITGANLFINAPANRKLKVTAEVPAGYNTTSTAQAPDLGIIDVTSSVTVAEAVGRSANASGEANTTATRLYTPPASGSRNFKLQMKTSAGTAHTNGATTVPVVLFVELA